MRNEKLTLSVDELAQELGISKPLAYELARREGFPAIRISERRIIIPVDALRSWLNANAGVFGG
ncbi:MAG: helix-turn-helix domain-containing protein [Ruminococcaceae bacterium]|nr:helix-turn-helix domain-containing protein [Oscillospiraceae bacterium]